MTRSASLNGFADLVRTLGGDPERLAVAAGLPHEALVSPEVRVPLEAMAGALELASRELRCSDFGLRLAGFQDLTGLGPLAIAIRHSETMRDAFDCAQRYLTLHNDGSTLALEEDPYGVAGVVGLRHVWPLPGAPYRQAMDKALLNMHGVVSLLAGGDYGLRSVELSYRPAAPLSRYEELYGGVRVNVGRSVSMLRIPTESLHRSIEGAEATLREVAQFYLSEQTAPGECHFTSRTRSVADALLGSGRLTTSSVAAALDTPVRTLQRRLREEGTTLAEVIGAARRDKAEQLLADASLSMSRVASLLDFTDQTTLSRAGKRWWGTTPREKRRELLGEAETG